jgi:hypothetical protein
VFDDLAVVLKPIVRGEDLSVVYQPPEWRDLSAILVGRTHFFFLRLPVHSSLMSRWARFRGRRTAVAIGVEELRIGRRVWVLVSEYLKPSVRDGLLGAAAAHVKQHVSASEYRLRVGFRRDSSLMRRCSEQTRSMMH